MRRLTLGDWLAETGLTLQDLAKTSGLHLSTLYEISSGRRWPAHDTLARIKAATHGEVTLWDADLFLSNKRVQPPSRIGRVRVPMAGRLAYGRRV